MKLSLIQMNMISEDVQYNFSHAEALLKEAAEASDVIVLPELWNTGFFPKEKIKSLADKNGQRTKELFSRISRENGVCIVGGSVTEEKDGRIYNICYIYNEKGECVSSYSKTHLFSHMDEHLFYTAGDFVGTFELSGIKAAVIICYDIRFPELARKLALEGCELLFVVSQWPRERTELLKILAKGRAVENQMFVAVCNSCGEFEGTAYGGNSSVFDPLGSVISEASEKEEIIYCDIDIDKVRSLRYDFNVFSDRREELY